MALSCTATTPTDDKLGAHLCVRDQFPEHATHRCGCDYDWQGAPRQAGTETQTGDADQARHDLEDRGVMTSVRQLTPASAGHAVRLLVADGPTGGVLYLDPQQAADLAHQLLTDAQEAIHADRTARR